jgi:hypothetical protein
MECHGWVVYFLKLLLGSQGSSVSIVSGYGLDDRAIEVRSPAEAAKKNQSHILVIMPRIINVQF